MRPGESVHNEQLGARAGRGAVGGVAEIGDLVAHAGLEVEGAPVPQLGVELALQNIENMPAVTPVIREIARRILDHSHANVANTERSPEGPSRLAGVLGPRHGAPI